VPDDADRASELEERERAALIARQRKLSGSKPLASPKPSTDED
jgi:hypothetical protein